MELSSSEARSLVDENWVVVDSPFSSKSTRPPGALWPKEALRQGLAKLPGEPESSPRPGSRDGMKQEQARW